MFKPNHLHILIKGYCTNPPTEVDKLNDFFRKLVDRVRMKVVAGPTSVYVSDPGNEGLTGTVTLATSHASIHVWDQLKPSMFQFDLYSCCEFSASEIINVLNEEFQLVKYSYWFIDRNDDQFIMKDIKIRENL